MATKKKSKKTETITITFCGKRRRFRRQQHHRGGLIKDVYCGGGLYIYVGGDNVRVLLASRFMYYDGTGKTVQAAVTALEKQLRLAHRELTKVLGDAV